MRNLTIKRIKSFAGCLAQLKIYIEDASSNELLINGIPCRKIGEIKNGEEKTFVIGEESAKVFVIADKLSRNYCNEFYQLPAGQEDVFLSGKCHLNPARGNAFLFDNNDSAEVMQLRKKGTKKGWLILCVALIFGWIIGIVVGRAFGSLWFPKTEVEPKTFTDSGMTITLTNEFEREQSEQFTVCYDSNKVVVFALKEPFSLVDGFKDYTLKEYGELVLRNNGFSSSKLKTVDELYMFDYKDAKGKYTYFSFVYKADDAFWLVQFATSTELADEYEAKMIEWAKTVSFE